MKRYNDIFRFSIAIPYLSSAIIGAVLRLEERHANQEVSAQEISDFKQFMMGPITALGDSSFGQVLNHSQPAALGGACSAFRSAVGTRSILVFFNLVHISIRLYGVFRGYAMGEEVCLKLQELALVRMSDRAQLLTAIMLGDLAQCLSKMRVFRCRTRRTSGSVSFCESSALISARVRRKIDATILLYLLGGGTFLLVTALNAWFPLT